MLGKKEMIEEILLACKANGCFMDGSLFLALAFRTESELKKICGELYIKT